MSKTTWNDTREAERRQWTLKRTSLERPSSVVYYIECPFCGEEVKAYLWSLCGCGKRCECGALFSGSLNLAIKKKG